MNTASTRPEDTRATLPFDCNAYQSYVRGLKGWWKDALYPQVIAEAKEQPAADAAGLESRMEDAASYQMYGWLERHLQQFKYVGRYGLMPVLAADTRRLDAIIEAGVRQSPELLRLDPDFQVPDYVKYADTHQHPGSTWSNDYDAFVHESATAGFSFTLWDSDQLVNDYGVPLAKQFSPKRILDLGCAGGKSTRALQTAAPQAEVYGCDVAAPVLKLGHIRSLELGLRIHYSQQSAEKLDFADGFFDLVASHWLFHEMPGGAIRNAIREARRVLRPGGGYAIYDMCLAPGGVIGEWLHCGYSVRNNEPFAHGLVKMDLKAELEAAGFTDVKFDLRAPSAEKMPVTRTHYMTMVTAVAR